MELTKEALEYIKRRSLETDMDGMNILAARNRESGNLEIGVPVLGNRLFCA